eukprot:TRINITY_DN23945_c0_g1_i2.p1 TRINITY_DN23945_c0_g1~~TRINITY_DN23945_c0_g1_i2.p1  ORF type:complete len:315 (+),score=47.64 TRINITY_DN23945_c0_g1_i2:205-1149(+)
MAVFESPQQKRDIVVTLTDPTAAQSPSDSDAREVARRWGTVGCSSLVLSLVAVAAMYLDTSYDHGTRAGVPFNFVTTVPARHKGLIVLTVLAHAAALFYPMAVIRKPRPHFLHVAGVYLVTNACTLTSMVATIWAGCRGYDAIRLATAGGCTLGFALAFVLLQYCILLKVEAIGASSTKEELPIALVRQSFHFMLNPITVGVGLLSGVVPLGVLRSGWVLDLIIHAQGVFVILFAGLFMLFTLSAVWAMLKCRRLLVQAALTSQKLSMLRGHLLVHCLATLSMLSPRMHCVAQRSELRFGLWLPSQRRSSCDCM